MSFADTLLEKDRPGGLPISEAERFKHLKRDLHQRLIQGMDLSAISSMSDEALKKEVRRATEELSRLIPNLLSRNDRERLADEVLNETFGLGPLEALMRDSSITDILINGPNTIYVERDGRLVLTAVTFDDEQHLQQIIQRVVGQVGRHVDEGSPMVDARLKDGSRFNAIIAPLALDGSLVSIRRFGKRPLRTEDLVAKGALTEDMVHFLEASIRGKVNMVVSGGTGSGKTTLLNALSAFIPEDERVVTIEDAAELRLQRRHVCRLETRPASTEGAGEITTRDLVRNALRMRPDRIIIGECRGPEAFDMLQAMNTGHEGSMTTIHANDTRDALSRLEMMVGMAGLELPMWMIRRQIAAAVHLVVQVARLTGGPRKVTKISETTGMEGEVICMQDLFTFKQTGIDHEGRAQGDLQATGIRPHCMARLHSAGIDLPQQMFERRATA
jgi:pilus assembly protein CpaF